MGTVMKRLLVFLCAMMLVFGYVRTVNAILIDRGGGLIYDSDQGITWLQDANYAQSSGYWSWQALGYLPSIPPGSMTWWDTMAWADGLEYYDSFRNVTWTDWRLPNSYNQDGSGPDSGYNATGSEMGHLYYTELGNTAGSGGFTNGGPFSNIQPFIYWSGSEYNAEPIKAWAFSFSTGDQVKTSYKPMAIWAWAVRDGDVGAPPIPEPTTILLLGTGIIGLAYYRRKKSKK